MTVGPGSVLAGIAPRDFKVSYNMIETLRGSTVVKICMRH